MYLKKSMKQTFSTYLHIEGFASIEALYLKWECI